MVRFVPNRRRKREGGETWPEGTLPPPVDVGAGRGTWEGEKLTGVVASELLERALLLVSLRDNGGDVAASGAVAVGSGHGRHLGNRGSCLEVLLLDLEVVSVKSAGSERGEHGMTELLRPWRLCGSLYSCWERLEPQMGSKQWGEG